jgi:hypothetical protein
VRPVPAPVQRRCARPSCAATAQATLVFAYDTRVAMLASLAAENIPQAYDLCGLHATRTRAPRGWTLEDRRAPDDPGVVGPTSLSTDLGGDRTVAVLAAALRAVPDPVSEDAVGAVAEVGRTPHGSSELARTTDGAGESQGAGSVAIPPAARHATRPPLALRAREGS